MDYWDDFTIAGAGGPPSIRTDDLQQPDWLDSPDQLLDNTDTAYRVRQLNPVQLQLFGNDLVGGMEELNAAVNEYSRKLNDHRHEPDPARKELLEDDLRELASDILPDQFRTHTAQLEVARTAEREILGDGEDTYADDWEDEHRFDSQYGQNWAEFNVPGAYGQPGTMYGMGDPGRTDDMLDPVNAKQAFRDATEEAEQLYRQAVRVLGDQQNREYAQDELGIDPVDELDDIPVPRMDRQ
ncbi:MAG: hypothetical protein SVU32_06560 [Candidatus Nanohaloarchaea archaeon]|nr:hypothetical protein [Candidatus Nanohaloarchaea archaeon]